MFGGTGSVTITNMRVGPCPKCGKLGKIQDGIYHFKDSIIGFIESLPSSIPKLKEVEKFLQSAIAGNLSEEATMAAVAEIAPSVVNIYNTYNISESKDKISWVVLLPILLTLIQLAMQYYKDFIKKEDLTPSRFEQHLLQEIDSLKHEKKVQDSIEEKRLSNVSYKNASRNMPCPCGSGKKYKICHGR